MGHLCACWSVYAEPRVLVSFTDKLQVRKAKRVRRELWQNPNRCLLNLQWTRSILERALTQSLQRPMRKTTGAFRLERKRRAPKRARYVCFPFCFTSCGLFTVCLHGQCDAHRNVHNVCSTCYTDEVCTDGRNVLFAALVANDGQWMLRSCIFFDAGPIAHLALQKLSMSSECRRNDLRMLHQWPVM